MSRNTQHPFALSEVEGFDRPEGGHFAALSGRLRQAQPERGETE